MTAWVPEQKLIRLFSDLPTSHSSRQVKFVCLNTNALEYDYSEPIPNFGFMEAGTDGQGG